MAPLPPPDLASRSPRLLVLPPGTALHRFHAAAFEPVFFDRSRLGRMNAPDGRYGVLYAALTREGAFAETFLRTPGLRLIDGARLHARAYVELVTTDELRLIQLFGPGLAVLGATAEASEPVRLC